MFRNPLRANGDDSRDAQQTPMPKPGDYDLGSLESRAAARALLDAKVAMSQRDRFRLVVSVVGRECHLEKSTCSRSLWPDGSLFEYVHLDGAAEAGIKAQLDELVGKVPIDGKKYTLGGVGAG